MSIPLTEFQSTGDDTPAVHPAGGNNASAERVYDPYSALQAALKMFQNESVAMGRSRFLEQKTQAGLSPGVTSISAEAEVDPFSSIEALTTSSAMRSLDMEAYRRGYRISSLFEPREPAPSLQEIASSALRFFQDMKSNLLWDRRSYRSLSAVLSVLDQAAEGVNRLSVADAVDGTGECVAAFNELYLLLKKTPPPPIVAVLEDNERMLHHFISLISRWHAMVEEILGAQEHGATVPTAKAQTSIEAEDQCPLLQCILRQKDFRFISFRPPFCELPELVYFHLLRMSRDDELQVGPIHSVHLFRNKKPPFYHEFVLISFGSAPNLSWLRIERAARQKHGGPLKLQKDSLGPALRGVPRRESASFSSHLQRLAPNSDEWAKILITPSEDPKTQLLFCELMQQAVHTGITNPHYQLFTANCRWFARRNFANVLQWCQSVKVACVMSWKGSSVSAETLQKKLESERFGGVHIRDVWGRLRNQRAGVMMSIAAGGFGDTMRSQEFASGFIKNLEAHPDSRMYPGHKLFTTFAVTIGRAQAHQTDGNHEETLSDAESAISMYGTMPETMQAAVQQELAQALSCQYTALRLLNRAEDAIPVMERLLEIGADIAKPDVYMLDRLMDQGEYLHTVGRTADAMFSFESAIFVLEAISPEVRPSHKITLADKWARIFRTYIPLLREASGLEDVLEAQKEHISGLQNLLLTSPDKRLTIMLTAQKLSLVQYAIDAGKRTCALEVARDAIPGARDAAAAYREGALCGPDQEIGEQMPLLSTLAAYAHLLEDEGRLEEACEVQCEIATIFRRVQTQEMLEERHQFLFAHSHYLLETGHSEKALESLREAIGIIKGMVNTPLLFPDARDTLQKYITLHDLLLRSQDTDYGFLNHMLGILEGWNGKEKDRIQTLDTVLDAVTACRASCGPHSGQQLGHIPLRQALSAHARLLHAYGQPQDACEVFSEVIAMFRGISSHEASAEQRLLSPAFYCQSSFLFEAGHSEEALEFVREAREIILAELGGGLLSGSGISIFETFTHHEFKILSSQDRLDDITDLFRQRVELFREISEIAETSATANTFRNIQEALASSLEVLGLHLAHVDNFDRSMSVMQEALSVYRALKCHTVAEHISLCKKMRRFSSVLSWYSRHEEALAVAAEGVSLARKVSKDAADEVTQLLLEQCIKNEDECRQRATDEVYRGWMLMTHDELPIV